VATQRILATEAIYVQGKESSAGIDGYQSFFCIMLGCWGKLAHGLQNDYHAKIRRFPLTF